MSTVAIFDIAGTILAGNPWRNLLKHPSISRGRVRLAYLRILPIWLARKAHLLSDTTFRHYWIITMAGLLKGMSQSQTHTLFQYVVAEQMQHHDRAPILSCLTEHKQHGDHVVLVSGLFDELSQTFAEYVGADYGIGSKLAYQDGICLGTIAGPTCGGPTKLDFIQNHLQSRDLQLKLEECYGYADSFSDVPLLEAVGHPNATYPDSELEAIARQRGWNIINSASQPAS